MQLPHLKPVLDAIPDSDFTEKQKEDLELILGLLLSSIGACVSTHFVHNTPIDCHQQYVKYTGEQITRSANVLLLETWSFYLYKHKDTLLDAIKKEVERISKQALGDPKIFDQW